MFLKFLANLFFEIKEFKNFKHYGYFIGGINGENQKEN